MAAAKDLYQILGVKDSASADEIKKAYRDAAKKFHPDKTGGDKAKEQRFKEISAAYDVLSDPQKRAQYDAMKRGGFRGFPGGAGAPGAAGGAGLGGLEDILAQVFGGAFGGAAAASGGRGGARRVIFEQEGAPFGAGGRRGAPGGGPQIFEFWDQGPGPGAAPHAAPPPNVEEVVRTPQGDEFVRRGDDLFVDVPLSVEEAVLGAKVQCPTLSGAVTLTIPAGTSSGKKLRLRGKGLGGRGDLYAVIQIVVPKDLDDKAREALREFARRAPVKARK